MRKCTWRRFAGVGLVWAMPVVAWAQAPEISDPDSRAPVGAMPGAYPSGVTAANVNAAPIPGGTFAGTGSDNIKIQFPAAGPIKWTESRHNEGDFALLIGPFDPNDASYFPPNEFVNDYKPLEGGQPFANTTLAWRVNQFSGALLATVRHNGVDNGDLYNGAPVGTIHGVTYFNADFGQGWGYRMNDGVFANGGNGSSDLQLGVAGFDDGRGEAVFNTAVAYFPYSEGWIGAWVNAGDTEPGVFGGATPGLDTSAVNWNGGIATVQLPGVNSATDGMLFVAPTNGGNGTDIAAALPKNGGWEVVVREDENAELSGQAFNIGNNSFQFLYVPYTATNLIGGMIDGSAGAVLQGAGQSRFNLTRNAAGEYAVSVLDASGQNKLDENDGMLILSVAGSIPTDATLPDRAFLSYEYDAQSGDFIVQSRAVAGIGSPNSENQFGDDLALRDTDFYFAWVDFTNPVTLAAPSDPADFNDDGAVDGADLAVWEAAFGVNGNADANGDGLSNGADLLAWQRAFAPAAAAAAGVPEPTAAVLTLLSVVGATSATRRRRG